HAHATAGHAVQLGEEQATISLAVRTWQVGDLVGKTLVAEIHAQPGSVVAEELAYLLQLGHISRGQRAQAISHLNARDRVLPTHAWRNLPTSGGTLALALHGHDRLLHDRAQRPLFVADRVHVGAGHDQRAPRAYHFSARHKALTVGRGDQVHLVLHRQYAGVGRGQRVGGVARGRVGDHADHAAVDEAVLLGNLGPVRQMDLDITGLDQRHLGADQAHRVLEPEARAHALGVVRITGLELRHFGSHVGVSSRRFTACFNVYVNVNSALKKCKRSGNLVAASADAGTIDPAHEL